MLWGLLDAAVGNVIRICHCHEINAKAIGLDLDSNPELHRGGWTEAGKRLGTPSSIEEAGRRLGRGWEPRFELRGERSKVYKEGSSPRKKRFLKCCPLSQS